MGKQGIPLSGLAGTTGQAGVGSGPAPRPCCECVHGHGPATATCLCWSATAPVLGGHVTTYHRLQRDSLFARLPKVFPDPGLALSGPIPGVDHVDTERTAGLPVDEEGGRKGTSGRATSSGSSRATHHMRDQVQCIFRVQPQGRTAQRCCFFISSSEKEKVDCCTYIELSDRQCCDL